MAGNRKRMKKAGAVLIAAGMLCGLAACGGDGKESGTTGGVTPDYQNLTQGSGWNTEADDVWDEDAGDASKEDQNNDTRGGTDSEDGQSGGSEEGKDTDSESGQSGGSEDEKDTDLEDGQDAASGDGEDAGEQNQDEGQSAPTADDYAFSTNDWKTLEFALDGTVYTFPLVWSDLEAGGFQLDEEYRHEVLESYYYTLSVNVENEAGERISVRFKNFTEEDREIQDCELYGVGFEQSRWQDVNPNVMLCNGVTFGMSAEEVKELMGEPDYYYESEGEEYKSQSMEYYIKGDSYRNKIELRFWEGELTTIKIENDE